MNSRDVFKSAMAHKPCGRLPIDIGGTSLTSMSPGCRKRLSEFLGISSRLPAEEQYEEILKWAGTDFRNVGSIIQLPSKNGKTISETEFIDCWGTQRKLVDEQWQIVNAPLKNASVEDLKSYPRPEPVIDDRLLESFRLSAKKLHEQNKYVVIGEHPYYGILGLSLCKAGNTQKALELVVKALCSETGKIVSEKMNPLTGKNTTGVMAMAYCAMLNVVLYELTGRAKHTYFA